MEEHLKEGSKGERHSKERSRKDERSKEGRRPQKEEGRLQKEGSKSKDKLQSASISSLRSDEPGAPIASAVMERERRKQQEAVEKSKVSGWVSKGVSEGVSGW